MDKTCSKELIKFWGRSLLQAMSTLYVEMVNDSCFTLCCPEFYDVTYVMLVVI